jgi:hypothetical protein
VPSASATLTEHIQRLTIANSAAIARFGKVCPPMEIVVLLLYRIPLRLSPTGFTRVSDPIHSGISSLEILMLANESAAYGMYSCHIPLPEIVSTLNRAGFENEDICMVLSPAHPSASIVRDARIEGANVQDAAVGANMIGWFSKFGAVVIPTVGFFIRSQAFLNALLIEDDGSALCGGSRTLAGLGFSYDDASRLGRQLGDLGALVYVSCPEPARAGSAIELLMRSGAREAAGLGSATAARAVA